MDDAKEVSCALANHVMLTSNMSLPIDKEKAEMVLSVLCASVVRSLMYVMVCIRPDIAHKVEVFSKFVSKLENEQCEAVK
ncbi:unnamed protein product [Linum trigynum]|uniref:Uncharacterized protein n=1 Tax=Linum trigynum TaxID=586398 RepID=A0AAV2CZW2_9ROSI